MSALTLRRSLLAAAFVVSGTTGALGYLVGPALPLEKVGEQADLIFKGEVLGSEAVQDASFEKVPGYEARETRFRIISRIKGELAEAEVHFRHYDETSIREGGMFTPQFYHFDVGRSYIVCAGKGTASARQLWQNHTAKMDLGVLRCRDQNAVTAKTLKEIYWSEIMSLRDSATPQEVVYAIEQLATMSEGVDGSGVPDFARVDVLAAVRRLITRDEPEVAQAAIRVIGDGSPYLSDVSAPFWLGTIGVPNPGLAQMRPGARNAGGALCWRELTAVAQGHGATETRALAIRALGLVKARELRQVMDPWLTAPEAPVRAAAVLLLTDFAKPHLDTASVFEKFTADASPEVRKCAAYAIGFTQIPQMLPVLSQLLQDPESSVRRAAGESLRSFDPQIAEVAAALQADLHNVESQPLSLLALARTDPAAHLEELARVIEEKTTPTNSSGGEIPAFTAWKILFNFLWSQPTAALQAGKWDRYLAALEKVGQYSSSEPRDIYAFYLKRGMPKRAAKWRITAQGTVSYDLNQYFDQVDKFPQGYLNDLPPAR